MSVSSYASASPWPVSDWFLKLPLYTAVDIGAQSSSAVKAILTSTASIDFYCPQCKKDSTFHGVLSTETQNSIASEMMAAKSFGVSSSSFWAQTIFSKQLSCTRAGHTAIFYFQIEQGKLLKVGQYPSIADIHYGESQEYAGALGEAKTRQLNQAIALAAQGQGLAALCYLQQLWDTLLAEIHYRAQITPLWDEDKYVAATYAEKLGMLGTALPNSIPGVLLEHAEWYEALDANLLSYTEDACMDKVDVVKLAVFFLVDQKTAMQKMKQRIMEAINTAAQADSPK